MQIQMMEVWLLWSAYGFSGNGQHRGKVLRSRRRSLSRVDAETLFWCSSPESRAYGMHVSASCRAIHCTLF